MSHAGLWKLGVYRVGSRIHSDERKIIFLMFIAENGGGAGVRLRKARDSHKT